MTMHWFSTACAVCCKAGDAGLSPPNRMTRRWRVLATHQGYPNLVISDYLLANGKTGVDAIKRLRGAFVTMIPAFLITGDTTPERMREANACGLLLLHKPVSPMALRSMVNQLLRVVR